MCAIPIKGALMFGRNVWQRICVVATACVLGVIGCGAARAETLVVNVPVLNMRSCPSTECAVIKKLTKGQRVTLNSTNGEWSNITVGDQTGYSIRRSFKRGGDSDDGGHIWLAIIVTIFLMICIWGVYTRTDTEDELMRSIRRIFFG